MTTQIHTFSRLCGIVRHLAVCVFLAALPVSASFAAFYVLPSPTSEGPGVALSPDTLGLTGVVLATREDNFAAPSTINVPPGADTLVTLCFGGTNRVPVYLVSRYLLVPGVTQGPCDPPAARPVGKLRSFVVDRGGGQLDFYYQLVNYTSGISFFEIFRIKTIAGFRTDLVVSVAQRNSVSGLVAGPGSGFDPANYTLVNPDPDAPALKPALTADRDVGTAGSIGFNFSPPYAFIGHSSNVGGGGLPAQGYPQASTFLVVRTNATRFGNTQMVISAGATSLATTFVPSVPPVDIGLRMHDGTNIIKIAAEPLGTLTSPLRMWKNGNTYGIVLTDTFSPDASKMRIRTSSGVKALQKLP